MSHGVSTVELKWGSKASDWHQSKLLIHVAARRGRLGCSMLPFGSLPLAMSCKRMYRYSPGIAQRYDMIDSTQPNVVGGTRQARGTLPLPLSSIAAITINV